jgi:hypothetical protein
VAQQVSQAWGSCHDRPAETFNPRLAAPAAVLPVGRLGDHPACHQGSPVIVEMPLPSMKPGIDVMG